ncbi:unnamed protein product [Gadus morhua 'NCC']
MARYGLQITLEFRDLQSRPSGRSTSPLLSIPGVDSGVALGGWVIRERECSGPETLAPSATSFSGRLNLSDDITSRRMTLTVHWPMSTLRSRSQGWSITGLQGRRTGTALVPGPVS